MARYRPSQNVGKTTLFRIFEGKKRTLGSLFESYVRTPSFEGSVYIPGRVYDMEQWHSERCASRIPRHDFDRQTESDRSAPPE